MKISKATIQYLQNFSTINQGIVFNPGNVLRTIAADGNNILAEAQIDEQFDHVFGVYDLKKLLALLSMAKDPDLTTDDTTIRIKGGKSTVSMRHTNIKLVKSPPDKSITVPYFITFNMSAEDLKWIFNTSSILGTNHVVFAGKDGKLTIDAVDVSGKNVDEGSLEHGTTEHKFRAVLLVERLKLMAGDYEVSISKKGVMQFANKNTKLRYWIALENEPSEFD